MRLYATLVTTLLLVSPIHARPQRRVCKKKSTAAAPPAYFAAPAPPPSIAGENEAPGTPAGGGASAGVEIPNVPATTPNTGDPPREPSPPSSSTNTDTCFPSSAQLTTDGTAPSVPRSSWWCPPSRQTGFLGFSYPLEDPDCSAPSNGFDKIYADMARMKAEYGATMVRIYAPECRGPEVWRSLLQAARQNNMGVILLVWWGFGDPNAWTASKDAMLQVLYSDEWKDVAPYVVHSVAFGSEPIGDNVQGGAEGFVAEYRAFKDALKPLGIPVAISEDWDRESLAQRSEGQDFPSTLTALGQEILDTSDIMQLHVMPYYRPDQFSDAYNPDMWSYFERYVDSMKAVAGDRQVMITQTQWASQPGGNHARGGGDNGWAGTDVNNFKQYWGMMSDKCGYWKEKEVGWFWHTWSDEFEPYFGLIGEDGRAKIDWKPQVC